MAPAVSDGETETDSELFEGVGGMGSRHISAMMGWTGLLGLLVTGHILLGAALGFAASPAPTLEVVDVSVAPLAVSPGEPVTVVAEVANPSNQSTEFTVVLLVDEIPEEQREVALPGGARRSLRFSVVRAQPGAHVVRIGPHAASFQVFSAQFAVRDLSINPPVVAPREPITVLATVENIGPSPGLFQVPLALDGAIVDVRSLFLPAGHSTVVPFETTPKTSGSYAVVVGDRPGVFTVVHPAFDVSIPSSIRISLPTTTSSDEAGASPAISQDMVTLSTASRPLEVTLPVEVSSGNTLASFRDTVSGIVYDGTTLLIPLRDLLYREVARLVVTPALVTNEGSTVRITAESVRLVVPDSPLQFPPATASVAPLSFSIEAPVAALRLDSPLRLTPGIRPASKVLAAIELEARARARTIVEVIASAALEVPASVPRNTGDVPVVVFGVPPDWLEMVGIQNVEVALIKRSGLVELFPVSEIAPMGAQSFVKAEVSEVDGIFILVVLSKSPPPQISQLVLSSLVTIANVPVEARAIAEVQQGAAGPANAVLWVNDEPVAVEPVVTLEDGARAAVFYLKVKAPGTYFIAVEGVETQLEAGLRDVLGHAQVLQLSINPETVAPGEPVEVVATVANAGPRVVVSKASLLVNGAPADQRLLEISAGEVAEVRFHLTRDREGVYEVALLNARGAFTVFMEPSPASFEVTALRVEPPTVEPDQPVTATVTLENTGEQDGTYLARIFLNRSEEERREISIGGLTALQVTFSLQPQGDGIFTVEVAGLRRDFVVVPSKQRSDLVLQTLTVKPTTVAGGEPVVVTLNIRNRATTSASGVMSLLVNEEVVAQRDLEVEPRGTTSETFVLTEDTLGLYQVEARQGLSPDIVTDVLKGQFLVTRKRSPASWQISRLEVVPQPAQPQEPLSLSFLLSNLGQQEGEITITVAVDGMPELEQKLRVGPETTRQVALPLQGRPEGTYVVAVNESEIPFTVVGVAEEPPVPEPTAPVTEDVPEEQASGLWLFATAVAALVALVGAVYGLTRWRRAHRRRT